MKHSFALDKKIYSVKLISQGIEDYSDIALITYKSGVLTIESPNKDEAQEIFNEFMNYIISLI